MCQLSGSLCVYRVFLACTYREIWVGLPGVDLYIIPEDPLRTTARRSGHCLSV